MAVLIRVFLKLYILMCCATIGGVCHGIATAQESGRALSEYRLKAVFLYNFTQFVEWPADTFTGPAQPFEICVLGQDPFGVDLDEVVQGESVRGRALVVKRLRTIAEYQEHGTSACQILFLGAGLEGGNDKALAAVVSTPPPHAVLTVGDARGKDTPEVMIAFSREKQRIRLKVDGERARAAGLTVSSKLLRIGT